MSILRGKVLALNKDKAKKDQLIVTCTLLFAFACLIFVNVTFGADALATIKTFIQKWVKNIGGLIGLIGAVDFALGWKNDDPSERIRGMKTFFSGVMMVAVGVGYNTFIQT